MVGRDGMLVLVLVAGVLLATLFMIVKLFLPRRLHAGYDSAVNGFFLNVLRLSIIALVLIGIYVALIMNGVVK